MVVLENLMPPAEAAPAALSMQDMPWVAVRAGPGGGPDSPRRSTWIRGGGKNTMKWYFSLSESSINRPEHGWRALVRTAVASAVKNTTLQPHMLYDGEESDFTAELRGMGVTVIPYRVSFYDALVNISPQKTVDYIGIATGVFPRVEIPIIEQDDDIVLFTDCDVIFRRDIEIAGKPTFFAGAPQTSKTDYEGDLNAGVMLMNVKALRETLPDFTKFIVDNLGSGWPGCDQENYRRFYKGKWDKLPLTANWKPYWGVSDDASIVHWHGPKPVLVRKLLRNPNMATVADWSRLFELAPDAYRTWLADWDAIAAGTHRDVIGNIDIINGHGVAGWALMEDDRAIPVTFDVEIDGKSLGSVQCNNRRADLEKIYGVEHGGFS